MTSFATVAGVLGGLLVLRALHAASARPVPIPATALFLIAGFALGAGGTRVITLDATRASSLTLRRSR